MFSTHKCFILTFLYSHRLIKNSCKVLQKSMYFDVSAPPPPQETCWRWSSPPSRAGSQRGSPNSLSHRYSFGLYSVCSVYRTYGVCNMECKEVIQRKTLFLFRHCQNGHQHTSCLWKTFLNIFSFGSLTHPPLCKKFPKSSIKSVTNFWFGSSPPLFKKCPNLGRTKS